MIAGLLSAGIEVLRLGVITTPGVAYLVRIQDADAGVMISATIQLKIRDQVLGGDGFKLSDAKEEEIEELLDQPKDTLPRPAAEGLGTVADFQRVILNIHNSWNKRFQMTYGIHLAVDGANGSTSNLVSRIFADLNVEFDTMATAPDGLNINKGSANTSRALSKFVVEKGAQVGLAFDGDGDRCIAVENLETLLTVTRLCHLWKISERGKLKQDTVVTTVMSNLGLYKALEAAGLHSKQTQVGDRYVVEEMLKDGYNLGGEQSGHVVFLDFNTMGAC